MEEQKQPSFFLIIFVLFLIVSIIIVTTIYIRKGWKDKGFNSLFDKEQIINQTENITYHLLQLKTNTDSSTNFKLYEEGIFLLDGYVEPNIKLLYSKAIYNKTYTFESWKHDEYYFNKRTCWVQGDMVCYLELKKIGNYSLSFSNSKLYVHQEREGIMQDPMLCISWTFDIYLVSVENFDKRQIPKRLRHLADVCYSLGGDISEDKEYEIDIQRVNPKVSKINFYLIDKDANSQGIITYEEDNGIPDLILEQQI